MAFNAGDVEVKMLVGAKLEVVLDFKYFGAWISSSAKVIKERIVLAWNALHKMSKIWMSDMNHGLKRRLSSPQLSVC